MAKILINGLSAKAGGGKAIFDSYLSMLVAARDEHKYLVLCPDPREYAWAEGSRLQIVRVPAAYQRTALLPIFYFHWLREYVRRARIDAALNFGDVVLPIRVPQVYFFDWAYAVYPESAVWERMAAGDYVRRRVKVASIKAMIGHATVTIAQTETMARRLKIQFGLAEVVVIPTPVSVEDLPASREYRLPEGKKLLLCLANHAPHKNLEVLVSVARLLRAGRRDFALVTTVNSADSREARELLATREREGLQAHWMNLGVVPSRDVVALLRRCDALMLPTLLESYGLPFIEAMWSGITVLTSDFDFAHDVCGDAAFYFDPMRASSILDAIDLAWSDESARQQRIRIGRRHTADLNDWPRAFARYQECIELALQTRTGASRRVSIAVGG